MYLIRGINNINLFNSRFPNEDIVATIGNFDGLHLGHQDILEQMKETNLKTMVIFTEPHAKEFFAESLGQDSEKPPRIFPWKEKVRALRSFGVNFGFFLHFNKQLRSMTPEVFIEEVLSNLNIRRLKIGDDFRFGVNREGDFSLLKDWGDKNNVLVENTNTFKIDDERVSSTRIRQAILRNDFEEAKRLLGKAYTYSGKVVYGQQLGRQLGIPTANIWLPKNKLPISGVYIVKVRLEGKDLGGIANMGIRPTVGGQSPVLEVHILNFSEEIYGKSLEVEFLEKVREEKKFDNLDLLKEQINNDISAAKQYFV